MTAAIHVHGGLANRLRAIVSWRALHPELTVAWIPDSQVHFERFEEAFQPLPGVLFVDVREPDMYSTYEPHPRAPLGWERGYLDLFPLTATPEIAEDYWAVHMRRTDCLTYQHVVGGYETDEAFIEWARRSPGPVFVATDNGTTQRKMIEAIPEHSVLYHQLIDEHERQDVADVRNTTLLHAAWDIFTCAGATQFKGTVGSSYSTLIHTLRGLTR